MKGTKCQRHGATWSCDDVDTICVRVIVFWVVWRMEGSRIRSEYAPTVINSVDKITCKQNKCWWKKAEDTVEFLIKYAQWWYLHKTPSVLMAENGEVCCTCIAKGVLKKGQICRYHEWETMFLFSYLHYPRATSSDEPFLSSQLLYNNIYKSVLNYLLSFDHGFKLYAASLPRRLYRADFGLVLVHYKMFICFQHEQCETKSYPKRPTSITFDQKWHYQWS